MPLGTPQSQDGFGRLMVGLFDDKTKIKVGTGFLGFFGKSDTGAQTVHQRNAKIVEIDITRGNEKTAVYVNRAALSRPIKGQLNAEEQRYTAFARQYPLMIEESDITADQILNRMAGENPYSGMTREARMRALAAKLVEEQIRRLVRASERSAAEAMISGQQSAIFGTANTALIYDFKRLSANDVTVSTTWATTTTIIADLDGAADKVLKNGRAMPDIAIMGTTAYRLMVKNTQFKSDLDTRRITLGQIGPNSPVPASMSHLVAGGMVPRGFLQTDGGYQLFIFTYNLGYDNSSGTFVPYMTADKVLITSSTARFDRYFGPSDVLPVTSMKAAWMRETFGFGPMVPMPPNVNGGTSAIPIEAIMFDAYGSSEGRSVTIRSQLAPIFPTTQTDAIATLDVVP